MKLTKIRNILHLVSRILFNVFLVVFGIVFIVGALFANNDITNLLSKYVFKDEGGSVTVNTGKAPVRYKTWYRDIEDILDGNGEIAWYAQKEGTVLLKNENSALPLAENEKVSLYGVTAYDPMYCLDGAGNNKINDPQAYGGDLSPEIDRRQFFYESFQDAGLDMNESLKEWYESSEGLHYRRYDTIGFWGKDSGNGKVPALTEASWGEIASDKKNTGTYDKDSTAIYITGRMTNEDMDLTPEGSGSTLSGSQNNDGTKSGDYLAFTDDEKNLLKSLGENYKKVIVIFNQANPPQENIPQLLKDYGIEAALWIGFPGSDGIKAVADIITGKINPSGGLSAAWYTSRNANPSTQNFAIGTQDNVVNMEGMYVGYRYAETRYEDTLLNSANSSAYDYKANISYPFGYGLSYSTFEYSDVNIVKDEDPAKNYYTGGLMASNNENYTGNYGKARPEEERRATGENLGDCDDLIMNVTVTNTGAVAGKEIVQVYLQQPITAQDRAHGVQKPSVQLIGYGKTKELKAGESETVEIKIDANKWFAAYDAQLTDSNSQVVGGYVLAEGDYSLIAARNSHEAVNSVYKANGGTMPNTSFDDTYGAGNAENVGTVTVSKARSESYKYWTQGTEDDVHNLFDDITPDTDKIFSRYNWNDTAAIASNGRIGQDGGNITGSATSAFTSTGAIDASKVQSYAEYYGIDFDMEEYQFGWSDSDYKLVDLIGVEYDPARGASEEDVEKWSKLVGQMSKDDFATLFSKGLRKTMQVDSIGKPGTNDQNASNGFEWMFGLNEDGLQAKYATNAGFMYEFNKDAKKCYPTGYPCEGIIAASFDNYTAYIVGQAIGEDALWGGAAGLYGFGLGLQRNPYHGRAGEFYSDDSFLTGMIGAYETMGAQSKGLYVYNKHFVLNDQDTRRIYYHAWIDEQTLRQVYLRPFEMAIEIGDAMNVMIAFNHFGNSWTGANYNLMTRWLRDEAGMAGFAISDYAPANLENIGYGMLAGACLLDGNTNKGYSAGVVGYDNRLVEAATRILYTVANSNAMNMIGESTETYSYPPNWFATRDAILPAVTITVSVLFGISCAFVVGTTTWKLVDKYVLKKD